MRTFWEFGNFANHMKAFFGVVGAVTGAVFGLIAAVAFVRLLGDGNSLAEAFLLLIAGPLGGVTAAIAGTLFAVRIVARLRRRPTSIVDRREQKRILAGLLVGVPLAFALVTFIAREAVEPPSDAAMLRHFGRQQSAFEELVKMAGADKALVRVDQDWTLPADTLSAGVSRERLAAYRKLLHEAGVPRGFMALQDNSGYDFDFWLRGSAVSADTEKGFAYRTSPPPNIVRTLDGIRAGPGGMVAYRHIRGNWYLFYEFIPG